jgi:hypothetical protein
LKTAIFWFLLGVLTASGVYEIKKPQYKDLRRNVKAALFKPVERGGPESLVTCSIPEVDRIPSGAVVIVGHAYGTPGAPDVFPQGPLASLLEQNRGNIEHVIFTGDVFAVPSKQRWRKLRYFFDDLDMEFSIAPGNHDVERGENPSRDVFMDQIGDSHLRSLIFADAIVILEDSTRNDWLLSENLVDAVTRRAAEHPSRKLFVARHNIPVEDLLPLANSKAYKAEKFPVASDLAQMFDDLDVTIVSGDSGAFPHLPRSSCHSHDNLTFYTNGLGGLEDDEILILHQGEIARLPL